MKLANLIAIGFATLSLQACQLGYVFRQGWGQMNVVWEAQPVEKILEDPQFSPSKKEKLSLILDIADFGERELGLSRRGNYTTFFDTAGRPISYNIFACAKTSFSLLTWHFPVVGEIPYLGYFDLESAKQSKDELEQSGFDVYLGTVGAYSTLGWFQDPILSSMLEEDEVDLARLILHEMTHATIYRSGESAFNESVASFVGNRGAELYLRRRHGLAHELLDQLSQRLSEEKRLNEWAGELEKELGALYESANTEEFKLSEREKVFDDAKKVLGGGILKNETRCNNAWLIALRIYSIDMNLFENSFRFNGGNLRRAIRYFQNLPPGVDALEFLQRRTTLTPMLSQ